jgi:hypothetical protein
MPARSVTRAACTALPRYKNKATLSQQITALLRIILWGDSLQKAVDYANDHSGGLTKINLLNKPTLHRLHHLLPEQLRSPLHATEATLLAFLQEHQAQRRANYSQTQSLLTQLEEELLVQWLVQMAKINLPIDRARLIEEARRVVKAQRGTAPASTMVKWYRGFRRRHPAVTDRICQDISKQRITAQENEANVAHYFSLLRDYRDMPPTQIYAGDETGLDGDGSRRPRVLTQRGTLRVTQQLDSYHEHTSLMHIGNAAGDTLPIIFIFKGKVLDQGVLTDMPAQALVGC